MTGRDNMPTSVLRALGDEMGLAASYVDFWGQHQELSEHTLQTLLRAMGGDAEEGPAQALLDRLRARRSSAAVSPVRVIRQSDHEPMPIGADLARETGATQWCLMHEDGGVWQGEVQGHPIAWPSPPPLGFHRLLLTGAEGQPVADTMLVVCPPRSFEPEALLQGERWWGPTVQLYALRSERNWGMGDFTDLSQVIDLAARQGAAFVGVSPLHALFPHDPERASPYRTSSRSILNTR